MSNVTVRVVADDRPTRRFFPVLDVLLMLLSGPILISMVAIPAHFLLFPLFPLMLELGAVKGIVVDLAICAPGALMYWKGEDRWDLVAISGAIEIGIACAAILISATWQGWW